MKDHPWRIIQHQVHKPCYWYELRLCGVTSQKIVIIRCRFVHSVPNCMMLYVIVRLVSVQGYQCSHCSKFYASKRLLRDHMCHHSTAYKCTFCAMACPSPSGLTAHIRYKHLDCKPFKCNLCKFTWVGLFNSLTDCDPTAWISPGKPAEVSVLTDE
jgi:hypothetical protein